jgi:hypothetical protein
VNFSDMKVGAIALVVIAALAWATFHLSGYGVLVQDGPDQHELGGFWRYCAYLHSTGIYKTTARYGRPCPKTIRF